MAKSYFHDGTDWRELVKGEQGERGPVGPRGPLGPAIDIETGLPIRVDTTVGTRVFIGDTLIHYDSGWHQIESYIPPEVPLRDDTNHRVYIRRENSAVWLSFDVFRTSGTILAESPILYIPQGFEPFSPVRMGAGSTYELRAATYTSGNELRVREDVASGWRRFYVSWSAGSTLPSELPGSPA